MAWKKRRSIELPCSWPMGAGIRVGQDGLRAVGAGADGVESGADVAEGVIPGAGFELPRGPWGRRVAAGW